MMHFDLGNFSILRKLCRPLDVEGEGDGVLASNVLVLDRS